MVFSFFAKEKKDDSLALIIDIGSASVGSALVRFAGEKSTSKTNKGPHVLATSREIIPFQEALSTTPFLFAMNRALGKSLKAILHKIGNRGAPAHIYCTLSSPWFIAKTRHTHISRESAFKVDEKKLASFLDEDLVKLKEELKDILPINDTVVVEKKIIQMKLNGYEVKNPYGQTTSQMEVVATISLSSDKVIESIEREIGHFFHAGSVNFGSFPLAAYSAVGDIFPEEKSFLFVDITGEATDISLVINEVMLGTISFPRGKNFFVREISAEFKTLHEEAGTLLSMFLRDALNGKSREAVSTVVKRGNTEWSTRFEKALMALAKEAQIPNTVFFTSDPDVVSLFAGLINNLKLESAINGSFEARYLDHYIVTSFATFGVEVVRDPFLAIEALFAAKLHDQK